MIKEASDDRAIEANWLYGLVYQKHQGVLTDAFWADAKVVSRFLKEHVRNIYEVDNEIPVKMLGNLRYSGTHGYDAWEHMTIDEAHEHIEPIIHKLYK